MVRFSPRTASAARRIPATPFLPESEVILYELKSDAPKTAAGAGDTGELLAEMGIWSFGLPFAEVLADGEVCIRWLTPPAGDMLALRA